MSEQAMQTIRNETAFAWLPAVVLFANFMLFLFRMSGTIYSNCFLFSSGKCFLQLYTAAGNEALEKKRNFFAAFPNSRVHASLKVLTDGETTDGPDADWWA